MYDLYDKFFFYRKWNSKQLNNGVLTEVFNLPEYPKVTNVTNTCFKSWQEEYILFLNLLGRFLENTCSSTRTDWGEVGEGKYGKLYQFHSIFCFRLKSTIGPNLRCSYECQPSSLTMKLSSKQKFPAPTYLKRRRKAVYGSVGTPSYYHCHQKIQAATWAFF